MLIVCSPDALYQGGEEGKQHLVEAIDNIIINLQPAIWKCAYNLGHLNVRLPFKITE